MSVRAKARRLAAACQRAMPQATITVDHSRAPWGRSSYVIVSYARGKLSAKARVSDHGIGERRYATDWTSLYLAADSKPSAWALWLADLTKRYHDLGGPVPEGAGLFAEPELSTGLFTR
jgi:hypothetical protein